MEFTRIEVMSGEGDQTSRVGSSKLKPGVEPPTTNLDGTPRLDGENEGRPVRILLDTGNGITSIS